MGAREAYARILEEFGLEKFDLEDARRILGSGNVSLILHRLCERGFLERVGRGAYRARHPLSIALDWRGWSWRESIPREYHRLVEFLIFRIFDHFSEDLVSLAIFGSIATGRAKRTSDLDILLIARNLPDSYLERIRLFDEATRGIEKLRIELWREKGIYTPLDPIILKPEEARITQPFYLDMIDGCSIIIDRGGFLRRKLDELRKRLREIGARRIELADGRWYWDLGSRSRSGYKREVLEI